MKFKIALPALLALAVSPLYAATPTTPTDAPAGTQAQADTKKDGEVIAYLVVLDKNELSAAQIVSKKKVSREVKSYAKLMKKDHGKNLNETLKLSKKMHQKPVETEMVISLREKGKQELSSLATLDALALEKAYIDAMVKGHEDALVVIDNQLTSVSNPALKKHLETTREGVAHHLDKAKEIQKKLNA